MSTIHILEFSPFKIDFNTKFPSMLWSSNLFFSLNFSIIYETHHSLALV